MSADANIARHLAFMASRQPQTPALKIPRGTTRAGDIDYLTLSFADLAAEAAAWRERIEAAGVRRGDRTLVMVRPGLPLIASAFALFQLGAVPVIIDPGMGLKSFLACVARSCPRALVGIPMAQIISRVFWKKFSAVAVRVPVSGSLTARLVNPKSSIPNPKSDPLPSGATDLAAVLFTSGSTGAPKGVCYTHGNFDAQVRLVRDTYGITPGEVDLPLLPIFALFNPALGMTTIVPELDPRRPADLDPARIVQAIRQENVTNSFGSPTLWKKIGDHCLAQNITLPKLRRVLCAGAPVPAALWQNSAIFLPNGKLHSPYGMTEALPVASVSADEVLSVSGFGACVGRPIDDIAVKIIAPSDGPLSTLADVRELPPGEPGEIIVSGPVVTESYDALPDATALAKIKDGQTIWHRTGDIGVLDADGRLWFHGRKAERVYTSSGPLDTEPCERVFRTHPRATRCALVGLGARPAQTPALVAETTVKSSREARNLARELRTLAITHPATAMIKTFYFRPKFPVDVRHNAKIHRHTLARWAGTARGYMSDPKR